MLNELELLDDEFVKIVKAIEKDIPDGILCYGCWWNIEERNWLIFWNLPLVANLCSKAIAKPKKLYWIIIKVMVKILIFVYPTTQIHCYNWFWNG